MEKKKITRATVKSFLRKNKGKLFVNVKSSFDGMTDAVERLDGGFQKAVPDEREWSYENTLGYDGIWITGRDRFYPYEDDKYIGIEGRNCCGDWIVAVEKA